MVGPAELPTRKEIKDLTRDETIGNPYVSPCLAHRNAPSERVQAASNVEFEGLEHFVYFGRQRLGHWIARTRYAAYDADDQPLGEFSRRQDAYAAVAGISEGGAR